MNTRLYVGGLSFGITQLELRTAFEKFGAVAELYIANDRETGRPRGFAFVTFSNEEECRAALKEMNGVELGGRTISVKEARPQGESGGTGTRPANRNDDAAAFYARANRRGR